MKELMVLVYLFVFLVLPFVLGYALSRALRVKDFALRIGFVLFTVAIGFAPFISQWAQGNSWAKALDLGIDLAGGTNLVYQVAEKGAFEDQGITTELMDRMVVAVAKRINPAGTKEIVIRRVGRDRIEVIVPGTEQAAVDEIKRQMTQLGNLEFAIVARRPDHTELIQRALALPPDQYDVRVGDTVAAVWRPIAPVLGEDGKVKETKEGTPILKFVPDPRQHAVREIKGKPGYQEVLIVREPEKMRVTGKYLRSARAEIQDASPVVQFNFAGDGSYLLAQLTTKYRPRRDDSEAAPNRFQMAVLLNDEVHSAPGIKNPIPNGVGIIEGFSSAEVREIVAILNSGALPREIKKDPISEFTISPTLGTDVQSKGKLALWVSTLAVIIFMAAYYLIAGAVADFAMLLNLLLIVASMSFIDAAFTLPGLAGLVLSAGMAVDANVLIYERIREETARGASLRMAIRNGFEKAFTAIFDSNLTTLITAVILYWIGTDQVKGFAVSLFIGLSINLLTAVFISRIVLEVMERSRMVKELKMMSLIGVTKFDFVSKQNLAIAVSSVLILIGLGAFVARGQDNYDIDFTGGTMVSMQFAEPQKTDDIRHKLEEKLGSNITLEELTRAGGGKPGTLFRLRTTDQEEQNVVKAINETFPSQLLYVNVTPGKIEPIVQAPAKEGEPAIEDPFAGGHRVELSFSQEVARTTIEGYLSDVLKDLKVENPAAVFQLTGTSGSGSTAREGQVRLYDKMTLQVTKSLSQKDVENAVATFQNKMANTPLFDEITSFASSVASETKGKAVLAILFSLVAIVIYVWFRFENVIFGLAAVVALAHDVLVTLGMVALASLASYTPIGSVFMFTDFKINMPMIAAFLTIVGYSLNDTIVIFDRMREIRGKNNPITKDLINVTVNQTLSRTILTALTVFLSVLILYVLGGEGIHGFAFAMVIGSIAGTYSTVYIASPLVLFFMERLEKNAVKVTKTTPKSQPAAAGS